MKQIPDPIAKLDRGTDQHYVHGPGKISLLAIKGIKAEAENLDFDIHYEIVQFTVSGEVNGLTEDATSYSAKFTDEQRDIIKKMKANSNIHIVNIIVSGPDGMIRKIKDFCIKLR